MKHAVKTLSAIALLAAAFVTHAGSISVPDFDVSSDEACWVAPEWKD